MEDIKFLVKEIKSDRSPDGFTVIRAVVVGEDINVIAQVANRDREDLALIRKQMLECYNSFPLQKSRKGIIIGSII